SLPGYMWTDLIPMFIPLFLERLIPRKPVSFLRILKEILTTSFSRHLSLPQDLALGSNRPYSENIGGITLQLFIDDQKQCHQARRCFMLMESSPNRLNVNIQ